MKIIDSFRYSFSILAVSTTWNLVVIFTLWSLSSRKMTVVSIGYEVGWASDPDWLVWRIFVHFLHICIDG
jgi:hypothetical protein